MKRPAFFVLLLSLTLILLSCQSTPKIRYGKINLQAIDTQFINGENINYSANKNDASLILAVYNQDIKATKFLLERGADPNLYTLHSLSPLNIAIQQNNIDIVSSLIHFNADINEQNTAAWTPLMTATKLGHLEIVKLLIDEGADILLKTNTGIDSIWLAKKNQDHDLITYLETEYNRAKKEQEIQKERSKQLEERSKKNLP